MESAGRYKFIEYKTSSLITELFYLVHEFVFDCISLCHAISVAATTQEEFIKTMVKLSQILLKAVKAHRISTMQQATNRPAKKRGYFKEYFTIEKKKYAEHLKYHQSYLYMICRTAMPVSCIDFVIPPTKKLFISHCCNNNSFQCFSFI